MLKSKRSLTYLFVFLMQNMLLGQVIHPAADTSVVVAAYSSALTAADTLAEETVEVTLKYDPALHFEEVWDFFEENYAFFDLRSVNWHQSYTTFRPQLSSDASPEELFNLFSEMLSGFHDPNVVLYAPDLERVYKAGRQTEFEIEFPDQYLVDQFHELCNFTLHKNGIDKLEASPSRMFYFGTSSRFAYLRIDHLESWDLASSTRELDSILQIFGSSKALIIDIRNNEGGSQELAVEIANRFTLNHKVGLVSKTRSGAGKRDFSPEQSIPIYPSGAHHTGKVVLLTNNGTTGAAEAFALMMRYIKRVKIIGQKTGGSLSEPLYMSLSNGWQVGIPNKRLLAANKSSYDGKGVPVNKTVVNSKIDLDIRKEPLISAALVMLGL